MSDSRPPYDDAPARSECGEGGLVVFGGGGHGVISMACLGARAERVE